ncbi:Mu transposase C-terminal domain-containing protein [Argonema antarcticum]|nr:Mu transposase C-terminal domain-containing protein [Argonema antarcticum]MCL1471207.1 Mu transposase C-terminal domain-containing protein [Argonema antarcticum A004/B2]
MKQSRRTIQRGGYLQFENLMYRGEYLAGYAGESGDEVGTDSAVWGLLC